MKNTSYTVYFSWVNFFTQTLKIEYQGKYLAKTQDYIHIIIYPNI